MVAHGTRYLIVGDGAAGMAAASELRRLAPAAQVRIVADDPHPAYYRAALTNYLIGELRAEQLYAVTPGFYRKHRVERVLGTVNGVDAARRCVSTADGALDYDFLLIATGSRPRLLSFPGAHLPGVRGLRTLADAQRMLDDIRSGAVKRAVVVGGGPLALEWAQGLREHAVEVTMLLRERKLMPGRLDPVGSDLVLHRLERGGVRVLRDEVAAAEPDANGLLARVRCVSGEVVACDLLALAVGIVPNADFLTGSGVEAGARGIPVDTRLETSVPGVYAAGDVAVVAGETLGLWAPAAQQGRIAAANMAGGDARYATGHHYFATRLFDLDFAYAADAGRPVDDTLVRAGPRGQISHQRIELSGGRIASLALLGERGTRARVRGRLLHRLLVAGGDVGPVKDRLLEPGFDLASYASRVLDRDAVARAPSETASAALVRRVGHTTRGDPRSPPSGPADSDSLALTTVDLPQALRRPAPGAERLQVLFDGRAEVLEGRSIVLGHGELIHDGDDWYARDLGSVAGTFVNGERVIVPRRLEPGDEVKIAGHTVALTAMTSAAPAAKGAKAVLVLRLEGEGAKVFRVERLMRVGRDPSCEVVLEHAGVSRLHAECAPGGPHQLFVKDLGSSYGTFVGAERLGSAARIVMVGEVLRIGEARLVVALESAA